MDLENYLLKNSKEEEISLIVKSLGDAAIKISNTIRSIKPQESISNNDRKLNSDGDIQKPLDIISDKSREAIVLSLIPIFTSLSISK